MITIRQETIARCSKRARHCSIPASARTRFQKTCERLREGRVPARGLSLVIERDGSLIGTVRLWHVSAGANRPALMLGPIAIDPSCQGLGLGAKLMREALSRSQALGHKAIVLVGDAPYYERFGFSADSIARTVDAGSVRARAFSRARSRGGRSRRRARACVGNG